MATNGIEMAVDRAQAIVAPDRTVVRKRPLESADDSASVAEDFALAPLVDKIAYGIARGLVVAVKELEQHIAGETRKVGDAVDRRLDALQASMQELTRFVTEQQSLNGAVQAQLETLTAGIRESDARQTTAVESLRTETAALVTSVSDRIDVAAAAQRESDLRREAEMAELSRALLERIESLCKELGVQQEDVSAIKATLATFSARTDVLVQRLDRQAEAVRSMYTAYSQRETELEQLVDGLARLRAFPAPMPSNGL
jgi:chromosome segregation ATPase